MRGTNEENRPTRNPPAARQQARSGQGRRRTLLEVEALEARVMPTVITIGSSKDNTLYESATGSLSDGAGPNFFAGMTGVRTSSIRRGVIAFDVAGNVPAGATINSVTLRLNMSKSISGPETVQLRRLLADWGEGTSNAGINGGVGAPATTNDATWVHRFFNTSFWTNPGGDFVATVSASASVGGVAAYTWGSTTQLVADVQAWLDTPANNFGWIVLGDETSIGTAKVFDTKENSTAANRPMLTIDFTAGGGGTTGFPLPARVFVTAADAGGGPDVKVFAADGTILAGFFAFDRRFTGGVRVAVGDVNGDGFPDIICAAGPGGGPNVVVFSGKDRSEIYNFFAFDMNFTGGAFVAAGDVNGDGFADIIVGADAGGGPNVFVLSGKDRSPLLSFFPYDIHFSGGVRVAAGDVNAGGRADIVTGAGSGGGPNVTVYQLVNGQPQVLQSYFAFDLHLSAGIFVGAGDVNGDGRADVIAGSGPLSGPDTQILASPAVAVFSGADAALLNRFSPFGPPFMGAVRVAATDLTGSGRASVIAVHGPGGTPDVDIFNGLTGQLLDRFFAYDPNFTGGLYLANTPR